MSRTIRRLHVVLNYFCIIAIIVFFAIGKLYGWSNQIFIVMGLIVVVGLFSFITLYIKTKIWKLVHTKIDKLDEREIQLTHESLRLSYSIFTVVSLLVLLVFAVTVKEYDSLLMIIFVSLLYLAHTLPAAIIAWKQKEF
ncbi:MAG: hypothetical protein DRP35_00430 [Candidatus Zixiibacteriota bacterium]|nr:MAG: hypothetical protein DRP35_00430 [candidate division Zixibacteria bacterium]